MGRAQLLPPLPRLAFVPARSARPAMPAVAPPAARFDDGLWVSPPAARWPGIRAHGPGFENLGNTCFLNSALQCLLHCAPLLGVLEAGCGGGGAGFCAFCSMVGLAGVLKGGARAVSPAVFVRNVRSVGRGFRVGRQEDAHEFVRCVLEAMVRAEVWGCARASVGGVGAGLEKERHTRVHGVFAGRLMSSVSCSGCGYVSETVEPFLDLSLEIANVGSVAKALAKFTAAEKLSGANKYRCEGCKKLVVATKRFSVRRAPNVLTLHLKRFDRSRKDSRLLPYSDTLDLAPFMYGKPTGVRAVYKLTGVLVHSGSSMHSGHYVSYVLGSNGTWCLKDDSCSRIVPASVALKQRAYMLFYTRDEPVAPKLKVPSPLSIAAPASVVTRPPATPEIKAAPVFTPFPGAELGHEGDKDSNGSGRDCDSSSSDDDSYQPTSESDVDDNDDMSSATSPLPAEDGSEKKARRRIGFTEDDDVEESVLDAGTARDMLPMDEPSVDRMTDDGEETEPSEPASSEPASSADDEETCGGSAVRAMLIGGGVAVQKVIRRVFGVATPSRSSSPLPSAQHRRVGASPPSSPLKSPKAAKPLNANLALKSPKTPNASLADNRAPERPGTSALFRVEGVDRWDAIGSNGTSDHHANGRYEGVLPKRKRANDSVDAEYDRGKAKKIRRRLPQSNGDGLSPRSNAFQELAEYKQRTDAT